MNDFSSSVDCHWVWARENDGLGHGNECPVQPRSQCAAAGLAWRCQDVWRRDWYRRASRLCVCRAMCCFNVQLWNSLLSPSGQANRLALRRMVPPGPSALSSQPKLTVGTDEGCCRCWIGRGRVELPQSHPLCAHLFVHCRAGGQHGPLVPNLTLPHCLYAQMVVSPGNATFLESCCLDCFS